MPRQPLTKMALAAISLAVFCSGMQSALAAGDCLDTNGNPICHILADCVNATVDYCECQIGTIDTSANTDGTSCKKTSIAVRYVLQLNEEYDFDLENPNFGNFPSLTLAEIKGPGRELCAPSAQGYYARYIGYPSEGSEDNFIPWIEMRCLYEDSVAAADPFYQNPLWGPLLLGRLYAGPTVQAFTLPTTDAPLSIPPTGLTVDSVSFNTSCAESGCWVIRGTITTGGSLDDNNIKNNVFNSFYLPHAVIEGGPPGDLSYDFDYTSGGNDADTGVEWTFAPANHPCTSASFEASNGNTQEVTTCCITNPFVGESDNDGETGGFLANYRPTDAFVTWASQALAVCAGPNGEFIDRPGVAQAITNVSFPSDPLSFLDVGGFKGMPDSPGVVKLDLQDPFYRQFTFQIDLDEVELRSVAGKLKGTVGVEHTVDTFLGLANFRVTGLEALDTFATQTNIHLEKTSFFSVSTHGVNEYTFLEYVNMRLVMIYTEDTDFSGETPGMGDSESTDRTVRTDSTGNANYVQVTFTMGPQYQPNTLGGSDLIPLDSVRAGRGTFFDSTSLEHLCTDYTDDATFGLYSFDGDVSDFNDMVGQDCGPKSAMCASPDTVPDQFVSFNIPLGFEVFDNQASSDLSNNIFVDFVVNVVDTVARDAAGTAAPNEGGAPWQMKTTLTASIPIVAGGINIFCDGYTAKTDLKDVANVDIVVGSAADDNELTRLRILEDIASTDLASVQPSTINTDSIESALMTLVIKGNESYFLTGATNTDDYTMELDDVITLHLMEDGEARTGVVAGDNTKEGTVKELLAEIGDDNSDSNGLDTNGYKLNGAFEFTIDRLAGTASLEPTAELLAVCPFNPPRPSAGSNPLESCILRRDVRKRSYPKRTGSEETAMEILAASRLDDGSSTDPKDSTETRIRDMATALDDTSAESIFLARILGDSDYTAALAPNFARAINAKYQLNGRFRRAYWINPGYEWTPTQTAGKSLFSVSQKIYLFALISLDENWGSPAVTPAVPEERRRRRMLLQTSNDPLADNDAGMNAASMEFEVTPTSMMAKALDVPVDRVALFNVELQLTPDQACMEPAALQSELRLSLEDMLTDTATLWLTVQVVSLSVDRGDEQCGGARRNIRKLLAGFSSATATVQMMVVFDKGTTAQFNMAEFATKPGVNSVAPDARNSPKLEITDKVTGETGRASTDDSDHSSSSMNVALIGGIAGGVVGALVLGVGAFLFMRKRSESAAPMATVHSINVSDLKSQLADDM